MNTYILAYIDTKNQTHIFLQRNSHKYTHTQTHTQEKHTHTHKQTKPTYTEK